MNRAVFFDRDGTINHDDGYIGSIERLRLINGAARAVRRINNLGMKVVIITNQSGIGRGYFTLQDVFDVNQSLRERLAEDGAVIDAFYICPHHPEDNCVCRKPATGMFDKAIRDMDIDIKGSYMVGDKVSDMLAACRSGAKGILVMTGDGRDASRLMSCTTSYIAEDISEAVDWIIADH